MLPLEYLQSVTLINSIKQSTNLNSQWMILIFLDQSITLNKISISTFS